jgi:hypothetical protein
MRAMAITAVILAATVATPATAATGGRLQGTWTMDGHVTRAKGVRGEHRGQRVRRTWVFASSCPSGACRTVNLLRERAGGNGVALVLKRKRTNRYAGRGRFFFGLRCNGQTYPRGGIAYYTLRLNVTGVTQVQNAQFATAITAAYTNGRRVNRTPCPGALGRDAGRYAGALTSAVPAPPAADFESSPAFPNTATFTDRSSSPTGAAIVGWSWNFGDPQSGAANASAERNPSHQYAAPGTYTVTLTVTDANGLTGTVSRQVVV